MFVRILFIIGVILILPSVVVSQNEHLLGTYMPYAYQDMGPETPPPGYEVVLINHISRHGSRYPISDKCIQTIHEILEQAAEINTLTTAGQKLLSQMDIWTKILQDKWGMLTPLGEQQQQGIGRRLVKRFGPQPFNMIYAWIDPIERCVESYNSFMQGIESSTTFDNRIIDADYLVRHNHILNFFETDSQYLEFVQNGSWHRDLELYEKQLLRDNNVAVNYISETTGMPTGQLIQFAMALYDCIAIAPDMQMPSELVPLMKETDMRECWMVENARQYLEKGPSPLAGHIQTRIAMPLLENFIVTTEEGLNYNSPIAFLRFAHAETIIPFAALLEIPKASAITKQTPDIYKVWKDYEIAPMAANIIWVVFKNSENHYLIEMFLNEQPVTFPIETDHYPYYEWDKVKEYYTGIIQKKQAFE